jgi:glycerate 2-kinase
MTITPSPSEDPKGFLNALFLAAVNRAMPARTLANHLPSPPKGRTLVIGAGKAAGAMAQAVEAAWPADAPLSGLVITRYGHVPGGTGRPAGRIEVAEAAHPVPDQAGLDATRRIVALTAGLGPDDLVLCLLSGGGSALLTLPAPGVRLEDKQAISQALLRSGATISEMNCVRKHFSSIKGGRLGAMCAPAQVVSLMISDVPGDAPEVIASGPTVADPTTCATALAILKRYRIPLPLHLKEGLEAGRYETIKRGDRRLRGQTLRMIATPQQSLDATAALARQAGLDVLMVGDALQGESREVGVMLATLSRQVSRPCLMLSGGETTVTLKEGEDTGQGGRASELLLAYTVALDGVRGIHALAADTDGIDGMGPNAGAVCGPDTLARAERMGLDAKDFLRRHDAFHFFDPLRDLVVTGPTFTNVNDFRAMLLM